MNARSLRKALAGLPLGSVRFFNQTGSTNDVALAWAASGAPDLALVYAEEQTSGRGRGNRTWFTPAGAALAFSLVFQPQPAELRSVPLFAALGGLAVCRGLESLGLAPQIKWPNDVLLDRRKVCGILAESVWMGERVDSLVLGIGINVRPEAVPSPDQLNFPAASVEAELRVKKPDLPSKGIDRLALLRNVMQAILELRPLLGTESFLQDWEGRLAFRGEWVELWSEGTQLEAGVLEGLDPDGSLRLRRENSEAVAVPFGEIHLRPLATQ